MLFFWHRYYGLSAKEEAAHVRHVKRFAKGLFYNIKGEADRYGWAMYGKCMHCERCHTHDSTLQYGLLLDDLDGPACC